MFPWPPKYFPADTARSQAIVWVAWLFPALASLSVIGRFVSRRLGKIKYGSDDWVMLAALLPVWGQTAIILITVYHGGMGHPYTTVPEANRELLNKCLTILPIFFGSSLGLAKTSILLILLRIFSLPSPHFRLLTYTLLTYILLWTLTCLLVSLLTCIPLSASWNPRVPGHCTNLLAAHTAISSLDILGDIMIIILPMRKIWRLQQDVQTRVMLTLTFGLGVFDVVCGVVLVVALVEVIGRAGDFTWDASAAWVWTVLEPSVAVVVGCAPSLKPLWRVLRGRGSRDGGARNGMVARVNSAADDSALVAVSSREGTGRAETRLEAGIDIAIGDEGEPDGLGPKGLRDIRLPNLESPEWKSTPCEGQSQGISFEAQERIVAGTDMARSFV